MSSGTTDRIKYGSTVYHKLNGQKMIVIELSFIQPPRATCRYVENGTLREKEFLQDELSLSPPDLTKPF